MKKTVLSFLTLTLLQLAAHAQAPAGFNYQGIARGSSGAPLSSKTLGLRITIHEVTASGNAVYQETQTVTTNAYGLYNLVIGSGTATTGALGTVDWSTGAKFIQIEMDAVGGTAYTDLGTSQLQSVPYAMVAAFAPAPTLTLSGNTLSAGGNNVTLPAAPTYSGGTGITVTGTSIAATNTSAQWNADQLQGKAISSAAPSTGQGLVWNGTSWTPTTPVPQTVYSGGTGITVSGAGVISANSLSGDVTGATNATKVVAIQNVPVSATAPTALGQVLKYDGTSSWVPVADTSYRGNATTGYIPMVTAANTLGNSLISQSGTGSSTRISVGSTVFGGTFDVHTNPSSPSSAFSMFKNDNTAGNSRQEIRAVANNLTVALGANNGGSSGAYTYVRYGSGGASDRFSVTNFGDNEQLTVLQNGNVGVNKVAPTGLFHLYQNSRTGISNSGFKNGMIMEFGQTQWSLGVGNNDGLSIGSYSSATGYNSRQFIDGQTGFTSIGYGTAPASTLDVSGSVSMSINYKNTTLSSTYSYSTTDSDYTIIAAPGAPVQVMYINLPLPSAVPGRIYVIKRQPSAAPSPGTNLQAVNIRLLSAGTARIYTSYSGATNCQLDGTAGKNCVTLQSDGGNWNSIGEF